MVCKRQHTYKHLEHNIRNETLIKIHEIKLRETMIRIKNLMSFDT